VRHAADARMVGCLPSRRPSKLAHVGLSDDVDDSEATCNKRELSMASPFILLPIDEPRGLLG
jgi:hypothetical protein